jgi:aquaporin Z
MRKYAVEFIGTFFLVSTICAVAAAGAPLAPLAIGAVLTAMVFAGGHISGAHYNPAVTLAVYLRGRLAGREVVPYLLAQLIAAACAAGLARLFMADRPVPFHAAAGQLGLAFTVELLTTFALAYVVLNVATSSSHPNNSFYGLAIGFTVLSGAIAFGGISGGAFNPAVGLGIAIAGVASWSMLWVYVVPTLLGGALAGFVFRVLNPAEVAPPQRLVDFDVDADVAAERMVSATRAASRPVA